MLTEEKGNKVMMELMKVWNGFLLGIGLVLAAGLMQWLPLHLTICGK